MLDVSETLASSFSPSSLRTAATECSASRYRERHAS
jgi:hypothetical protein